MSELPAFGENPPGTSKECNQIVKSVQQATTNFLEAITGLVQQSVRSPTRIPPTSIAASSAVTTGATSSNTGIASTSGLPVSGPVHLSINRLGLCYIPCQSLLHVQYRNWFDSNLKFSSLHQGSKNAFQSDQKQMF